MYAPVNRSGEGLCNPSIRTSLQKRNVIEDTKGDVSRLIYLAVRQVGRMMLRSSMVFIAFQNQQEG